MANMLWRNSATAGAGGINVRLFDGSNVVPQSTALLGNSPHTNAFVRSQYLRVISGLTPGDSVTWSWQFNNNGSGTAAWWYGGETRWTTWMVVAL
jgi:hypothetical protein